ncbi:TetR/AcrR family transcriptional regulator [Fodinicola feengrottensis]|uniref:HTH tetR-type domain-containing protein n=1 Tax=Fodinicola feengrottensis TaxID=435914 RepID=A0ABN2J153_9ACTN|nr:TetR/AcrR family transcriptional regulator [Fodinicola feengrottensis]
MRERILAAAIDLFGEVGYDKASIRELGRRLGVTSAALYYHFGNKEEILLALADTVREAVEAVVAAGEPITDLAGRRKRILADYFDVVWQHRKLMAVLESSLAAVRNLPPGVRTRQALERLTELLATDPEAGGRLRAAASLSLLTSSPRLVGRLSEPLARRHLLAAARGALEYAADELTVGSSGG